MKKHCLERDQALFLIIDLQEKLMKAMDYAEKVYKKHAHNAWCLPTAEDTGCGDKTIPKGLRKRAVQEITEHFG